MSMHSKQHHWMFAKFNGCRRFGIQHSCFPLNRVENGLYKGKVKYKQTDTKETMTLYSIAHISFDAFAVEGSLEVGACGCGIARRMQTLIHVHAVLLLLVGGCCLWWCFLVSLIAFAEE